MEPNIMPAKTETSHLRQRCRNTQPGTNKDDRSDKPKPGNIVQKLHRQHASISRSQKSRKD